jgi:hypothetical protein
VALTPTGSSQCHVIDEVRGAHRDRHVHVCLLRLKRHDDYQIGCHVHVRLMLLDEGNRDHDRQKNAVERSSPLP